jgi:BirA family transcriptional regulator, biotin operon repressor / biotin---[acetyl-CoA-carboxylase] ligase
MSSRPIGPIRRFDEIDSTNRYLVDEARAGAPSGLVAVAGYQTAGKGRLGRSWEAPAGANLLMSVLLRPGEWRPSDWIPVEWSSGEIDPHDVTIAVALAAADACRTVAGVDPGLKWPNDLLVDDLKLAGILAELVTGTAASGSRPGPAIVVGLGLNVGWPPRPQAGEGDPALPGAGSPVLTGVTSLARLVDVPIDIYVLLTEVLEHLDGRITRLVAPNGKKRQVEEYTSRCVTLGRLVRVEMPKRSFEGRAVEISAEGHLVVETGSGAGTARELVAAGDVVHLGHVFSGAAPKSP